MSISAYSTTPGSNTTISGINIAEGCNASGLNDALRQLMADIKAAGLDAACIKTNNLSDLSSASGARTNLAVYSITQSDAAYCSRAANLNDVANTAATRANLGITTNLIAVTYTISTSAPSLGSDGDLWFKY